MAEHPMPSSGPGKMEPKKEGRNGILRSIFADDIKGAIRLTFRQQILPKMKNVFVGSIHDIVNAVFNTKPTNGYSSSWINTSSTNYQQIGGSNPANYQQITTNRISLKKDLRFETEADAIHMKELMENEIQTCGFVTVGKVYDWLEKKCPSTWYNYGWLSIDSARIVNEDGVYRLSVPAASPVERG